MSRVSIPSVYDDVRKAYADMGYPVSGDRLVVSRQPTYVNGKPAPADVMAPEVSGGNTQNDGTVRINPDYRAVMRHWGVKGSGRDFLRTIIGHELGHHVDRTVLRTRARSAERRRLLQEIARSGFHTVYTDSYGPGTDRRKLDKELLAEYLAQRVSERLGKRAELRDGTYSDVKKVYDALSGREKDLVTPGRTVYKDVQPLSRTVAYDGDVPVGFADWYGQKGRASLCVAVSDAARGRGLARDMALDSVRKIIGHLRNERAAAVQAGGDALRRLNARSRIRRFVWGLAAGNESSARAAAKAGFTEQVFKRLHKGRRFVLSRADAERMFDESAGSHPRRDNAEADKDAARA